MFRSKVGTRQAKLTSFLGPPPSQPRERIPRVEATAAPTSLNFWTCTYCTFVNHNMDAPVCLICGGERAYFDSTQQPSGHLDVTSVGPALEKRAPDTHETDPTQEKKRRIDRCGQIGSFGGTLVPRSLSVGGSVGGYSITPTPNPHLDGLYIILDFIDANTEAAITAWLDSDVGNPWQPSTFNGRHLSKTWGVRTDLSTGVTRLPTASEPTFPPSTGELNVVVEKLRAIDFGQLVKSAKTWFPNEANANMYVRDRGHYLSAHYDHRAVSGPILATLSLGGDAHMTFTSPKNKSVRVDLPRRSIQLVCRSARYNWTHEIKRQDIHSPSRTSVTFRMTKLT